MLFQNTILTILGFLFLYFNYKIVLSDLKAKKIPNKYLGFLLLIIPLWWGIIIFWGSYFNMNTLGIHDVSLWAIPIQVGAIFIVSFILYYFGIWAAGDAKYLLVLSLFIPYIGVIPFAFNVGLLTLGYLFIYFIYFYCGKLVFQKKYRKKIFQGIKTDLEEKWKISGYGKSGSSFKKILKFTFIFLVVFTSIRLIRFYMFKSVFNDGVNNGLWIQLMERYSSYIILVAILLFVGCIYIIRVTIVYLTQVCAEEFKLNTKKVGDLGMTILTFFLIAFIVFELRRFPDEIGGLLVRVFTLYLFIYFLIKFFIYSYKITFGIGEAYYKNIKDLKEGDIIDAHYLIKMFKEQEGLGYVGRKPTEETIKERKNYLLYPSPIKYFQNLDTAIDKKNLETLKKVYSITNSYHTKKILPIIRKFQM